MVLVDEMKFLAIFEHFENFKEMGRANVSVDFGNGFDLFLALGVGDCEDVFNEVEGVAFGGFAEGIQSIAGLIVHLH